MKHIESSLPLAADARAADPDRYMCALFVPPRQRAALFALILFNAEIARVRELVSEPMLGRIRLQWWREAIDGIYGGQRRRHEVADALAEAIATHGLTRSYFERLIDARESDLEEAVPENMAAFERYAEESAAPLVSLALEVAGAEAGGPGGVARHTGIAWALTGLMRALPYQAAQGRVMLPGDVLEKAGLTAQGVVAGRERAKVARAVQQVSDVARQHLRQAREHRRVLPRAAKRATLQAVLAGAYLSRLAACAHDPYHRRATIGPLGRQLLLSRAAFFGES
ncbi:MAG: phytoene/squalene synthase family protein [Alphaproteobacteria bacterium]|jgi:phytoene synthase|nr:phytoene/squalene synthase family protein [Alphaproteobacteria bacterium]MDP6590652.1 phytoene/squalene synthase family protein [Alphaproteobacteria bacterium]MDP6818951.1 phytoene/squalene synthase family protein [Alphaproteobacteria bacterium]